MCVLAFDWRPDGPWVLRLAGNRDEFYARPTAPMAWWEGGRLLAGRDLQAGGTWLGVDRRGRLAALTNHRDPHLTRDGRASRGQLPVDFLRGDLGPRAFLEALRDRTENYNPFNLLLFDGAELLGFESLPRRTVTFPPGVHGVSNGAFDAPWPKLEALKGALGRPRRQAPGLWSVLADATPFPDERLPQTGIPLELERDLSPVFVGLPQYGTRASTVLTLGPGGMVIEERRHGPGGLEGSHTFRFVPEMAP